MSKIYFTLFISFFSIVCRAQVDPQPSADSLKAEILLLRNDVGNIKLNLGRVENRFKTGILISTLGYSTVIAGGLMLGRKNDELGKGLLIVGGFAGVTGTILMVDAFRFLGIASGKKTGKRR